MFRRLAPLACLPAAAGVLALLAGCDGGDERSGGELAPETAREASAAPRAAAPVEEPAAPPPAPFAEADFAADVVPLDRGCAVAIDASLAETHPELRLAIERQVRADVQRIQAALPVEGVTINVKVAPDQVIPGMATGGWAMAIDEVWITIDPDHPSFAPEELGSGIAHELHHAMRYRSDEFVYVPTLLEMLVTEGLADRFAIEVFDHAPRLWSTALDDEQAATWLARAEPILREPSETWEAFAERFHRPWFFGAGDDAPPPWTGYALGWRIVDAYLSAHPEETAASLCGTSAEVIWAGAVPQLPVHVDQ